MPMATTPSSAAKADSAWRQRCWVMLDVDLDIRLACADAHGGNLAPVLAAPGCRHVSLAEHKGMYETRLGGAPFAGGDAAATVLPMAEAAERADDHSRTRDRAAAQARFGDVVRTAAPPSGIDTSLPSAQAAGFISPARGVVHPLRRELASPGEAVTGLLRLAEQPASCAAPVSRFRDHAVALNMAGALGCQWRQVVDVWPVLHSHQPKALLRVLEGEGSLLAHAAKNTIFSR